MKSHHHLIPMEKSALSFQLTYASHREPGLFARAGSYLKATLHRKYLLIIEVLLFILCVFTFLFRSSETRFES